MAATGGVNVGSPRSADLTARVASWPTAITGDVSWPLVRLPDMSPLS